VQVILSPLFLLQGSELVHDPKFVHVDLDGYPQNIHPRRFLRPDPVDIHGLGGDTSIFSGYIQSTILERHIHLDISMDWMDGRIQNPDRLCQRIFGFLIENALMT
jgi:hypothetical protein